MVRTQAFPWGSDPGRATDGQFTWVFLQHEIDYDQRIRRIHSHCLAKFHKLTCEVCGEAIGDVSQLPPELQEKVYKPGEKEIYKVDLDLSQENPETFGNGERLLATKPQEIIDVDAEDRSVRGRTIN